MKLLCSPSAARTSLLNRHRRSTFLFAVFGFDLINLHTIEKRNKLWLLSSLNIHNIT